MIRDDVNVKLPKDRRFNFHPYLKSLLKQNNKRFKFMLLLLIAKSNDLLCCAMIVVVALRKNAYFSYSAQNKDCGYSLEPPRRGGSNEYPQSMFF